MSSFLYRLGRFAAQRRRSVLAAWLVILVLACGGALFNDGTDDTFEIPGTQSQDALDYLARVFPETSGSSAQLVMVVPPAKTSPSSRPRRPPASWRRSRTSTKSPR